VLFPTRAPNLAGSPAGRDLPSCWPSLRGRLQETAVQVVERNACIQNFAEDDGGVFGLQVFGALKGGGGDVRALGATQERLQFPQAKRESSDPFIKWTARFHFQEDPGNPPERRP